LSLNTAILNCLEGRNLVFNPGDQSPHLRIFHEDSVFKVFFDRKGPGNAYRPLSNETHISCGLDCGYVPYTGDEVEDDTEDLELFQSEIYLAKNIDLLVDEAWGKLFD
jgi:hypothetical protein